MLSLIFSTQLSVAKTYEYHGCSVQFPDNWKKAMDSKSEKANIVLFMYELKGSYPVSVQLFWFPKKDQITAQFNSLINQHGVKSLRNVAQVYGTVFAKSATKQEFSNMISIANSVNVAGKQAEGLLLISPVEDEEGQYLTVQSFFMPFDSFYLAGIISVSAMKGKVQTADNFNQAVTKAYSLINSIQCKDDDEDNDDEEDANSEDNDDGEDSNSEEDE